MRVKIILIFLLFFGLFSCENDTEISTPNPENIDPNLTIFFVNDQHGRIDNFSKVKAVVDEARADGNVLLVCSGDIFAGNPIVDQFSEQGFPMVDIMNEVGFDVATIGNHEFDFGTAVLADRIDQSSFPWILANVDASNSVINQPEPFVTLTVGEFTVTFLGLIETNGKENDIIPSTHPLRVDDLSFQRHQNVIRNYENLKAQEGADVLVGLTHLGSGSDRELAQNNPFFDFIIGGHSHELVNTKVNGVPIVQAGSNLQFLGRIDLVIEDKEVVDFSFTNINLSQKL
ncbi:MAG: metallophosphatase [Bacteroidota bacterium]